MKHIDLRSDAETMPTQEMLDAITKAKLGDAILGEDPTVIELERLASSIFDMEDAMLTISGTMANQVAVMTMTERGQEVIMGKESHLYNLEVAGLAALSQVQARSVSVKQGLYDLNGIEESIQPNGIQIAKTGLICLENTYNLNEGSVVPLENMKEIRELANAYGVPIYLDGARLFNAAAYLNVQASVICKYVDAVQICLTKGLGCPVGSILLGSKSFIREAKKIRQRLGGGMRQAGIIAAPGIIALTKMTGQMKNDHQLARKLSDGLSAIQGIKLTSEQFQTNIVSIEIVKEGWNADQLVNKLKSVNILVKKIGPKKVRMVTHHQISSKDIDEVLGYLTTIIE
ncbi:MULTISPECIES: threonine aldolase family protein [unclassified Fredinandcohnia]|uniref:threonine aldolase family protein n=1 Tax=unclassified Fredinandcohnia TaxID=2837514 RepID=UPI0030FDA380